MGGKQHSTRTNGTVELVIGWAFGGEGLLQNVADDPMRPGGDPEASQQDQRGIEHGQVAGEHPDDLHDEEQGEEVGATAGMSAGLVADVVAIEGQALLDRVDRLVLGCVVAADRQEADDPEKSDQGDEVAASRSQCDAANRRHPVDQYNEGEVTGRK